MITAGDVEPLLRISDRFVPKLTIPAVIGKHLTHRSKITVTDGFGVGFLWKPYCISTAFDTFFTPEVLYCDCNLRFKDFRKFEELYNEYMFQEGMFIVKHKPWINGEWTKRDAFILMNADTPKYWMAHQVWSVILGFDKNPRSREILEDYLYYCRISLIVTEYPNMCGEPNLDGFREHRWEQSVIGILAERYGVKGVWDVDVMDSLRRFMILNFMLIRKRLTRNG